ncbi:hypothetical protein [Streptomyces chartreusis]|uniref:hypothetical protein n=1 Tax=Streptomyces chartreusis TaxID=1969 RepID=UPI002E183CEA
MNAVRETDSAGGYTGRHGNFTNLTCGPARHPATWTRLHILPHHREHTPARLCSVFRSAKGHETSLPGLLAAEFVLHPSKQDEKAPIDHILEGNMKWFHPIRRKAWDAVTRWLTPLPSHRLEAKRPEGENPAPDEECPDRRKPQQSE